MKKYFPERITILTLIILGLNCNPIKARENFFPELAGWKLSEKQLRFDRSDLYDYIDGAADSYLSYEFEEVLVAEYTKNKQGIKAEIYRHSNQNNGFGIYATERFPDYQFIEVGGQAYRSEDILNMVCGRYYVKLFAETRTPEELETMITLAQLISSQLETPNSLPEELNLFPLNNKIENSEQYINQGFLGYDFLSKAFTADYSKNGANFKLFIIRSEDAQKAKSMLSDYLKFTNQQNDDLKEGRFLINDKYNGKIPVLWNEKYIFGCLNLEDPGMLDYYFNEFHPDTGK